MLKPSNLSGEAENILNLYLNLPFTHTTIPCPYWMNLLDKNIKGPFSGKGTPKQIVHAAKVRARKDNVKIESLSDKELTEFLKENRIGVDCSGFVFHLVNKINLKKENSSIADRLIEDNNLPSWRAAWRCNADRMTHHSLTAEISLKDIRAGDLIRMMEGRHVLIVVEVKKGKIKYAHSSYLTTKKSGVHTSEIKIVDEGLDLSGQIWKEKTPEGAGFGDINFNKSEGDSIRRYKWWD